MKRINLISLAIVAAFAANTAQADVIANAYLGPLSYTLVDLDDTDGVIAAIDDVGIPETLVQGFARDSAVPGSSAYNSTSTTNEQVNTAVSTAGSNIGGKNATDGSLFSYGSTTSPTPGNAASFLAQTSVIGYFELSGNTEITFEADADIFAAANDPYNAGDNIDVAYALAGLSGVLYDLATGNAFIETEVTNDSVNTDTQTGKLRITLRNTFSQSVGGFLSGFTEARGTDYTNVSAVPVPAALPLMASALGLFGLGRRKNWV